MNSHSCFFLLGLSFFSFTFPSICSIALILSFSYRVTVRFQMNTPSFESKSKLKYPNLSNWNLSSGFAVTMSLKLSCNIYLCIKEPRCTTRESLFNPFK